MFAGIVLCRGNTKKRGSPDNEDMCIYVGDAKIDRVLTYVVADDICADADADDAMFSIGSPRRGSRYPQLPFTPPSPPSPLSSLDSPRMTASFFMRDGRLCANGAHGRDGATTPPTRTMLVASRGLVLVAAVQSSDDDGA